MLNPIRVDAAVDLAYGTLILLAIVLIATVEFGIGLAFGLGAFSGYIIHVVWKMARFDPEWMTTAVEETVRESVQEKMAETVEETVGEQFDAVQEQVQTIDERVNRRPREDQIEEIVKDAVDDESEK